MTRLLLGGAIAAITIASVAAVAQPAPPAPPGVASGTAPAPGAPHVRMMMMNGDRVMTRDAISDHVRELFAKLDTNHDGFIVKDEVEAIHKKMMGGMGSDMHKRLADHGVMIGDRGTIFDQLDTNHDGNISRQEFVASKPQMREERVIVMRDGPGGPEGHGGPGGHGKMGRHMHGAGMAFGGHMFEMADANHDGRVSLQEAEAAAFAHFERADANHDGKVSPDERHQMRQEVRIERRPG